jgi:hypothetical protein
LNTMVGITCIDIAEISLPLPRISYNSSVLSSQKNNNFSH